MSIVQRLPYISSTSSSLFAKFLCHLGIGHLQSKSTQIDLIDSFTNELIEKRMVKIYLIKEKYGSRSQLPISYSPGKINYGKLLFEIKDIQNPLVDINIDNLTQGHIDNLVIGSISNENADDFYEIINQCIKKDRLPSIECILLVFRFLGEVGDLNTLNKFAELCRTNDESFFTTNVGFSHFIAKGMWISGNLNGSLRLLYKTYSTCDQNVLPQIRNVIRSIVNDTVGKRGDAVLVSLTQLAIDLDRHLNDPFVLGCIWRTCFLSDGFSDQQFANELSEQHGNVLKMVKQKAVIFSHHCLNDHNVDAVHRFIELLLKYELNEQCRQCLGLLFDYQYWRTDWRACSEIMQTTIDLDMPLSESYSKKLSNLLVGEPKPNKKTIGEHVKFELRF